MAKPWEQYQQTAPAAPAPWLQYQAPAEAPSEIPAPRGGFLDALSAPFEMGMGLAQKPRAEQAAVIAPAVEALGAAGGAAVGSVGGPLGTVLGSGAGYAGAKELMRQVGGTAMPETLPQATQRVGETALTGAALEAGGRGVIGPLLDKAAKAAGWVWDAATGTLSQVRAGKIIRQIAGADLDKIKTLAANAPSTLTAAQATQPAGSNVLAAMGEKAAKNDVTNYFTRLAAEQEAARQAARRGITPDLATVTGIRQGASDVSYPQAFAADVQRRALLAQQQQQINMFGSSTSATPIPNIVPQLQALKGNPIIDAAAKEAKVLAASRGKVLDDPMASLEGLHYMKVAIDNQFKNRTAATALQNYSDAALGNTKTQLLTAIEDISPLYAIARKQHAELSIPVNQAQLLGEMGKVLAKPGGGERVTPFLNALGQGETALIKRAGGEPRFGGIEQVLSPKQMAVVEDIASQFTRDLQLAQAAAAGRGGLSRILGETKSTAELPPSINLFTRTVNKVLNTLEGQVNTNTLNALEKGMRSGKDLTALINTLPSAQKKATLNALSTSSKGFGRAATFGVNALNTDQQQSQNALAP